MSICNEERGVQTSKEVIPSIETSLFSGNCECWSWYHHHKTLKLNITFLKHESSNGRVQFEREM